MAKLDQFESSFRAAARSRYQYERPAVERALVFTDLAAEPTRRFEADVRGYLAELGENIEWSSAGKDDYTYVDELLAIVEARKPDLICAYRNLHGRARSFPFSLGSHVDVLSQATSTPLLLLPDPDDAGRLPDAHPRTERVLVITDHLTGSDQLVNYGVRFALRNGELTLAHIEDGDAFDRYIDIISKLPSIDTSSATEAIRARLMKEPHEYIASTAEALSGQSELTITVHEKISIGHPVKEAERLATEGNIDLIVLTSKDDRQRAMSGQAYATAVELRSVPILLV